MALLDVFGPATLPGRHHHFPHLTPDGRLYRDGAASDPTTAQGSSWSWSSDSILDWFGPATLPGRHRHFPHLTEDGRLYRDGAVTGGVLGAERSSEPIHIEIRPETVKVETLGHEATGENGPIITGSPEFQEKTSAALDRAFSLKCGAPLVSKIREIRESSEVWKNAGGYIEGGVFHVFRDSWNASTDQYASGIVHEGWHAANPNVFGSEAETGAFLAQAEAMREMGHHGLADYYEREAANPTHHILWEQERNARKALPRLVSEGEIHAKATVKSRASTPSEAKPLHKRKSRNSLLDWLPQL